MKQGKEHQRDLFLAFICVYIFAAETLDSCTYSSLLVTCLADKGRTNCGDWPVGNLPFHQG